jgi:alpha-beta hydrolase superfamily lysophospholipase
MKAAQKPVTHILRTRIKRNIICEFLPPMERSGNARGRERGGRNKVIVLCGGMPGYPGKSDLSKFLSGKGYWVFIPRYRGSWESDGSFLKISPHRDVLDVITALPKGFKDLWSGKIYKINRPEVYLIGSSFGGPAVILASRDPRVRKAVALSPVTDWRVETKTEPIEKLGIFTRAAFGNGYRGTKKNWDKLKTGKFYNPAHEAASIDGSKLLIIHAKDDKVVYARTSIEFAQKTRAQLVLLKEGGHLSLSRIEKPKLWKEIERYIKK